MASERRAATPAAAPTPPAVVLVRTQEQGNIGSTARAMANMGLERLILVAPRVPLGATARAFAVGAGHVLDQALVVDDLGTALAGFQRVVGTTSARARSLEADIIAPRKLPARLAKDPPGTATALVFGPEASGLKVEELALCSPAVNIPCSPAQPTLNLAQAVLIVAYELAMGNLGTTGPGNREPLADHRELDGLFEQLRPLLGSVGFDRDGSFDTVMRDLRTLAARAGLREREVSILRGICRRSRGTLERLEATVKSLDSPPR